MPRSDTMPLLSEAVPYPGSPRCWKRVYDLHRNTITGVSREGVPSEPVHMSPPGTILIIWGYSCRSRYAEDAEHEDAVWENRRAFPALCFSEIERHGEWGFVELDEVTEVTEAELREAVEALGGEL